MTKDDSAVGAAARTGNKLTLLRALRDRCAAEIDTCPTRDLSPLTRRLQDIVADISELEAQENQEKPGARQGRTNDTPWDPDKL